MSTCVIVQWSVCWEGMTYHIPEMVVTMSPVPYYLWQSGFTIATTRSSLFPHWIEAGLAAPLINKICWKWCCAPPGKVLNLSAASISCLLECTLPVWFLLELRHKAKRFLSHRVATYRHFSCQPQGDNQQIASLSCQCECTFWSSVSVDHQMTMVSANNCL